MKTQSFLFYLDLTFSILIVALITAGSLGFVSGYTVPLSIIAVFIFLGIKLINSVELKVPPNFIIFSLFVCVVLAHTLLFDGKIIYFWMFFTGGLYWLSVYNLPKLTVNYFNLFLTGLGIAACGLMIYFKSKGINFYPPDNLFLPAKTGITHNHIGDLWAIILVLTAYYAFAKPSLWQLPLAAAGIGLIAFSYSRSAVVSLVTGISFVVYMLKTEKKFTAKYHIERYLYPVLIVAALAIFTKFSISKSFFFARPYFLEALTSLISNPFGVGMGNFETVSASTNVAHNLVLEIVSGMGVFSLIFIYWLYSLAKTIFAKKNLNIGIAAVAIAMFANFMFDTTYVIPGFFWLWFIALAMI